MEKIEIDIIKDILKSRIALHDFGKPVKKVIAEKIKLINSPTLVVLDLRRANPMDYEFINISFNEIVSESLSNANLFIVFKIDKGEFEELCYGIVDILKLKIEGNESEKSTLEKNDFSMIYVIDEKTQYLSSLSSNHMKILTAIEECENLSSTNIQGKINLIPEEIIKILEDLLSRKFIIRIPGAVPVYKSVKSFI